MIFNKIKRAAHLKIPTENNISTISMERQNDDVNKTTQNVKVFVQI